MLSTESAKLSRVNNELSGIYTRGIFDYGQKREVSVVLIAVPAPELSLSPPSMYRELAKELSLPI
jgi:hypothetical protein